MNISKTVVVGLFAAALMASAAVFSNDKNTIISEELATFNDQFNAIAANYDIDAFLAMYVEEPLWIAPGKAPVAGLDVPRATFDFFASNKGSLTHTVDHKIVSADGSQAILIGQYDLLVEKVGVKATGTYQFVLQKDDKQWKILTDMYNQHDATQQ